MRNTRVLLRCRGILRVEATLLLLISVHQKFTKCHRPNVVCSDQCAGHPFLVLLLMLPDQRRDRSPLLRFTPFEFNVASSPSPRSFLPFVLLSVRRETNKSFRCTEIARFHLVWVVEGVSHACIHIYETLTYHQTRHILYFGVCSVGNFLTK